MGFYDGTITTSCCLIVVETAWRETAGEVWRGIILRGYYCSGGVSWRGIVLVG